MENIYEDIEGTDKTHSGANTIISRIRRQFRSIKKQRFVNEHLTRIGRMRLVGIINDKLASILFQRYMSHENKVNDTEIRMYWNCYKMCKQIIWNTKLLTDDNIVNKLIQTSPPFIWEQEILKLANMSHEPYKSKHISFKIYELMTESIVEMECNIGYHNFLSDMRIRKERIQQLLEEIYDDKIYFEQNEMMIC